MCHKPIIIRIEAKVNVGSLCPLNMEPVSQVSATPLNFHDEDFDCIFGENANVRTDMTAHLSVVSSITGSENSRPVTTEAEINIKNFSEESQSLMGLHVP